MKGIHIFVVMLLALSQSATAQGHLLPLQTNGTFISGSSFSLDNNTIWGLSLVGSNKGLIDAGIEANLGLSTPEFFVGDLTVDRVSTLQPFLTVRPINTRLLIAEAHGQVRYSWIQREAIEVDGKEPGLTKYGWRAGGMLRTRIPVTKRISFLPGFGGGYLSDTHESEYTRTVAGEVQVFEDQTISDTYLRAEVSLALRTKRGEILGLTPFFERRIDADNNFIGFQLSIGTAVWNDLPVLISQGTDPVTGKERVVAVDRAPDPPGPQKTSEQIAFEEFISGVKIIEIVPSERIARECSKDSASVVCQRLDALQRKAQSGRLFSYVRNMHEEVSTGQTYCDVGMMHVDLGFITENTGAIEIDYEDCNSRRYPFRKRAEYADSTAMWNAVFDGAESFLPEDASYNEGQRRGIKRFSVGTIATLEEAKNVIESRTSAIDPIAGIYNLDGSGRLPIVLAIVPGALSGKYEIIYLSGAANQRDWAPGEAMGFLNRSEAHNSFDLLWRTERKLELPNLSAALNLNNNLEIELPERKSVVLYRQ